MLSLILALRRRSWRNRLRPLLFALACLQVIAPATAAVADAWRTDQREPYLHIEEQGSTGCVVVHDANCLLCSIATTPQERTSALERVEVSRGLALAPVARASLATPRCRLRLAPSRAPPASLG